jgi:hypothetical protein
MMAGGEGGLEGWLVFKFKSVRVCLRAACFEHSLRLSSGKRSTAGAGAGAGQQGQPVFAYAGREGRSFNATRGQALLPAVIGGHARAALDAVNIYCRPGRLLRARAYVRSTAHAAHRRPRYGRRYTCRRSTSGQHIEAAHRGTPPPYRPDSQSMASPRMCHRAALAVRRERGNGVEMQQQATCLSTLAAK